jgi:hypothetical protein
VGAAAHPEPAAPPLRRNRCRTPIGRLRGALSLVKACLRSHATSTYCGISSMAWQERPVQCSKPVLSYAGICRNVDCLRSPFQFAGPLRTAYQHGSCCHPAPKGPVGV